MGTELGFQVLRQATDSWEVIYSNADMNNLRINKIIELSATEILISSERGGIQKLDLSNLQSGEVSAYIFGKEDGLEAQDPSNSMMISELDGEIIASTDAGLFRMENGTFVPTEMDGLSSIIPENAVLDFVQNEDDIWAYSYNRLFGKNGEWYEEDVSGFSVGGIDTASYLDDQLVVGGLGNILLFTADSDRPAPKTLPVTLTSAVLVSGQEMSRDLPLDEVVVSTNDRLTLQYAVADFSEPEEVRYRTRLQPNKIQFSAWTTGSEQSLVALAPGAYTFNVEARDSLGQVSSLKIPVIVEPQWFETLWFRSAIGLVLFCAL